MINTQTDTLTNRIPVGNAPRQVVLDDNGTVAYVSNEGGRPANPANPHEFTNMSDGTPIVSNPSTGAAITGTVSVVNLTPGHQGEIKEIPVGLQPTALYQDESALFVANSNDDSMSVIDEQTNRVTQTVRTNPVPGAQVGSYANAINMSDSNHVLVSIGRDNAIAVYRYKVCTRQCASSACSRLTGIRFRSSPIQRSVPARSWSPTTRGSAPAARRRRSTRGPTPAPACPPSPITTPTTTPAA